MPERAEEARSDPAFAFPEGARGRHGVSVSAIQGVITHDLVRQSDDVDTTLGVALVHGTGTGVTSTLDLAMSVSSRRWSWTAFIVGLIFGVPIGAVGLIVVAQLLTVVISLP